MVAGDPDAVFELWLGGVEGEVAGALEGEGVGNVVGAQVLVVAGGGAEPGCELFFELVGSWVAVRGSGYAEEGLFVGRVAWGDVAGDAEVLDEAVAAGVEGDHRAGERGTVGGEVVAAGAVPAAVGNGGGEAGGFCHVGGEENGTGVKGFAGLGADLAGGEGSDLRIEANGVGRKAFGKLLGDGLHALGGKGGVAVSEAFEYEFEHAA